MNTKQKIKHAMKQEPLLTNYGIGIPSYWQKIDKYKNLTCKETFSLCRAELLRDMEFEGFENTCAILEQVEKIKTINIKHTSYGLKHYFEDKAGYVTNGIFIASAIYSGFKLSNDSPNPKFNMSNKSLKMIFKSIKSGF